MFEKQVYQQKLLLEITQYFAESSALEATIPRVLKDLCSAVEADSARIVLNDGDGFYYGMEHELLPVADKVVLEHVMRYGQIPLRGADLLPETMMFKQMTALPLVVKNQPLGILWLGFEKSGQIDEIDQGFIAILAGKAALAIANAQAYEALHASRRRLEAILTSIEDAVVMIDGDRRIQVFNPAAETLFSTSAHDALGKPIDSVVQHSALLQLMDEKDLKGARVSVEVGAKTFQPLLSEVMDDDNVSMGRVLILADVSHLRRLNENMTLFLQTVSHDLRSPLTAAKGFVDMLAMVGELNEKQTRMQDKILTSITDMTNLVEKVLDAGRLDPEMGAYELRRDLCDPAKVVQKVVSTMTPSAQKKAITLKGDVDADVPLMNVDEMMLERALWNLVENAIKYTPEKGEVTVKAAVKNNTLELSVQDNGLGIPEDKIGAIFDKGSRVRREEHKAIRGSGLGLFIVRNVARQHGGEATVHSEEGKGSVFSIAIPISGENVIGASS